MKCAKIDVNNGRAKPVPLVTEDEHGESFIDVWRNIIMIIPF